MDGLSGGLSPLQDLTPSRREEGVARNIRSLHESGTADEKRAKLRQASKDFEAIFVRQVIGSMRKTIGEGGLLNKSNGQKIFEEMLDEEWAKKLSGRGGEGSLSGILYRQLSRQMGLAEDESDPRVGGGADFIKQIPGTGTPPVGLPASERKRP